MRFALGVAIISFLFNTSSNEWNNLVFYVRAAPEYDIRSCVKSDEGQRRDLNGDL